jgi:predicted dehydrogenase
LKVAIAGLGGAATRGHLPAIRAWSPRIELVAAADPDPVRRAAAEALGAGLPTFGGVEEMLEAVEFDVLVVATQPSAHSPLAAAGLRRRRHVLCEKPVALTKAGFEEVAGAQRRGDHLALVSVHQYRFSPTWTWISRWLRCAARGGFPFTLRVEVARNGTDIHAASGWRGDLEASGGMLVDHGTHFLALARTVTPRLRVLAAEREWRAGGREQAKASVMLGHSGTLELTLDADASARRTRIEASALGADVVWTDRELTAAVAGKPVLRREVEALSDRAYVDSLYVSIYRHLLGSLGRTAWRRQRTAESLSVAETCLRLVTLAQGAAAPSRS